MSDHVREIFWVTNYKGSVPLFVSPAFETIYGRTVESLFQNPSLFFEACHPDDRTKLANQIRLQRNLPTQSEIEFRICRPDGEIRWLWARMSSIVDEDGEVRRLCGITSDITERKEVEKRVSEFYSTMSHELRTPLTSIRGSLGLMEGGLAGKFSENAQQLIKLARRESDRLIRLINDILDIRKIEAGMLELKRETVDASLLVSRTIDAMEGMAKDARVKLVPELNCKSQVECDADRIIQVLTNLVSNAIKYSTPDSEVTISIDASGSETVRFTVGDKGPGIAKHQMHKLFGMFQQLDQSDQRKQGGTGLGLAITKAIVEQHGGTIGVNSIVGEGSKFWFELPEVIAPPPIAQSMNTLNKRLLNYPALLIEDDDTVAELLKVHLRQDSFEVIRAATLAEAEKILETLSPLCIILDLALPDGNGLDLFRKLSANEKTCNIPVVVVTGQAQAKQLFGSPTLVDWIQKPVDEKRLHKALSNIFAKRFLPVKVLLVEDDPATREVLRQQLSALNVQFFEAIDGAEALSLVRQEKPDLIILDLVIPAPDGFDVVNRLRKEDNGVKRLIIYTASDITDRQKNS